MTVTLSSAGVIGGDQEVLTDARGTYQFIRLVPGTYTVTARLIGFSTRVQEGIVVSSSPAAGRDGHAVERRRHRGDQEVLTDARGTYQFISSCPARTR